MRVSVLWSELSGYLNTCLRTLVAEHRVALQVFRIRREEANAAFHPYAEELFAWLPELHTLSDGSRQHYRFLHEAVTRFQPDLLLISGWTQPAYLRLAKTMRRQGVYVICGGVDNQWQGTAKQWLGVLAARWRLRPYFDALWTPGRRAAHFAHQLGYRGSNLLEGFYVCDRERFAPIGRWRLAQKETQVGWPRCFLYTGRLTEEKGIRDLLTAYQAYRNQVDDPWALWIVGSGPLMPLVQATPTVRLLGFLQPDEYATILQQVGAFILPSRVEPWGVVVQEAMSAALPVICSRQCGSAEELVQEGRNGFTFPAGDTAQLTKLLVATADAGPKLRQMGETSVALASRFTPEKWAQTLVAQQTIFARN